MRILAQLVFGMIVYITLLRIAGRVPVAAGLMLTFPALNGRGLLFEGRENAAAVARTMILPPLINGLFCAVYIWVVIVGSSEGSIETAAGYCTAIVLVLWVGSRHLNDIAKKGGQRNRLAPATRSPNHGDVKPATLHRRAAQSPMSTRSRRPSRRWIDFGYPT